MKPLSFIFCLLFISPVYAFQTGDTGNLYGKAQTATGIYSGRDTIYENRNGMDSLHKAKENKVTELFMIGKNAYKGLNDKHTFSPFKGHWSGLNYGFVNFTNTDYSMYPAEEGEFMELDWTHSFALQFNLLKYSISFVPRNNFGLVCGLGLEYQRLRFEKNYLSIANTDHTIQPVYLHEDENMSKIKRSTFKTLYLTIPMLLEVQFPSTQKQRLYVSGGLMGGVRMHSKTKVVFKNEKGDWHKEKSKGNFNMVPFKVDAVARVGYKWVNVWGSYTLTKMFKDKKGPELHAYTVGLGVTF